jgi:hypothetical protein
VTSESSAEPNPLRNGLRDGLKAALPAWVLSRLLVVGSFAFAHRIIDTIGPARPGAHAHLHRGILGWDAERYYQIAEWGYGLLPRVELRFFPLVPLLARALDVVLPGSAGVALVVQANVFALVLGVLVHRLVMFERGDAELARAASWLVLLTPAAFVLVWGYTEALWGCLCVGVFLAMRREKWWAAAVVGVLAGLTRPTAPLLCLPLLIEVVRQRRFRPDGAAALVSPLAGVGIYLWWVGARFGDALYPYRIQQNKSFRGSLTDPVRPVLRAIGNAVSNGNDISALRIFWVVVLVALVVMAFKHWPLSYAAFAAVSLLVALGTERLGSLERYGFSAFPVVLALAVWVRRRPVLYPGVVGLGCAAVVGYGTLALIGGYVP